MKLHLPKQLLNAVLLAASTFAAYTVSAADSISINFTHGGVGVTTDTTGELGGVGASGWNNVAAGNTGGVSVNNQEGDAAGTISISNVKNSWNSDIAAGDTLTSVVQHGYIDAPNNEKRYYSVNVDHDYWLTDVTLYMSADTAGQYASLNVNGVSYKGGDDTIIGSGSWGTIPEPSGVTEYNGDNSFTVTNVIGDLVVSNEYSGGNRATLAGLQVVDRSDIVYTSTLSENAGLADVAWSKVGVEGTVNLSGITGDKYLSVAAEGENRTLDINADTAINGLQLTSNSLTLISTTDKTLTVGALHANEGAVLTADVKLAGKDLALTGKGEIRLKDFDYTGGIGVGRGTTLTLLAGTQKGRISNSGTVHINAGSESVHLNNLIDRDQGAYNPTFVTNTADAKLVIDHSGNKTLNGGITIANGGRVILKGGTLGTADNPLGATSVTLNNTILELQDLQAYLSSDHAWRINGWEIGDKATLHLTTQDSVDWGHSHNLKILQGGTLNVNATQSLGNGAVIELAGGKITGAVNSSTLGLDFYEGGQLTVTADSVIETNVGGHLRPGGNNARILTFAIASGKTLTMTGNFVGVGQFDKAGAGTLIYNGAAFTNNLTISAGEFVYNGDTLTNNITVNGGKFVYNGDKLSQNLTLTLNGGEFIYSGAAFTRALEIAGGVFEYVVAKDTSLNSIITGAGTFRKSGEGTLNLSLGYFMGTTSLDVAQGKMVVNAAGGEYEKTISGAAGTVLEKTGKGTLKTDGSNFAGHVLVSDGTFQLSAAMEQDNRTMTVANGATLDVNGKAAYYNLTLQEGATLTNSVTSGSVTDTGKMQFGRITLEGTATVSGNSEFGMVGRGWSTSFLGMNGNTLIKEGSNTFFLENTTVSSAGTIQVDGGTLQALQHGSSGVLDISKLSVEVNVGGTFQLSGSSESIQDLNLAGGALVVDDGHTLTAAGTTTMSGGSVTGNLCLSGAIILEGGGTVDLSAAVLSGVALSDFKLVPTSEETPRTSGLQSLTYTLWSGDGTVTSTQDSIVIEGKTYTMDSLTGTFVTEGDIFYVATGETVKVGGEEFTEDTDKATVFVVDGTLNVAGKPANDITINLQGSSTLTTSAEGDIGSITLAGDGLYDMGAITNVRVSGLGDSAKWTGTVRLSGELPGGADLNSYGNANSKIEMVGVSGWLRAADLSTSSRLILTKETKGETVLNGFTVSAASTRTYSFLGGVQGEGDFTVNNGGDGSPTYTFGGDLSEWRGLFHVSKTNESNNGTVTLNLSGGGTLFTDAEAGVKLSATGGTLNVNIGSAAAETVMNGSVINSGSGTLTLNIGSAGTDTVMNGSVTNSGSGNLTVNLAGNVEFNQTVVAQSLTVRANQEGNFKSNTTITGTVNLESGASLNMGGGTAETRNIHSLGGLSAADNASSFLNLGQYADLTVSGTFDFSQGGDAQATGTLGAYSTLKIEGSLWMGTSASLILEEGAKLEKGLATITGIAATSDNKSAVTSSANQMYNFTGDAGRNFTISNADISIDTNSGNQELTNKLVNASVINTGSHVLTVNNAASTITNLHAQGGDITVNAAESVQSATVDAGRTLTLAGGVSYIIASIDTTAGGEVSLGAGTNLTLSTVLPNGDMGSNTGNNNEKASLELNISSAADSKNILNLQLDDETGWQYNNTVKLTSLTGNKTVDEVHVSGALAADVFSGTAKTNLGGAKLVMSDGSHLVMRKSGANAMTDFGASSIELKGTTTMDLYGNNADSTRTLTSDISGGTLKTAMNGAGKLTGALNLAALEVGSTKLVLGGATEKKLGSVSVLEGKTLEVASGSSMQLVDSAKNTVVTFSAGTDKAATLKGTNGTGTLTQLQDATAFTIADMTLSNVTVSAATSDTSVNLTNVKAEAVQLAQGSFTMTNTAEVGTHSVDGSTASFTTDLLSGITLNNADSSASLVVDLGDLGSLAGLVYDKTYNLTITLSGFTMNYEAGTGLLFAADSWLGQLLAGQGAEEYVSGSLETPAELAFNTTVTVQYDGITGDGGANVGTIITITGLTVIPEPTTTTLSLLALCGLVARRRRK